MPRAGVKRLLCRREAIAARKREKSGLNPG